jgi:uncharacterized protein (DUF1697 family)
MTQYIAFLRGVNVGGNSIMDMKMLSQALSDLGLRDVRTLLNSGNVLFNSDEAEGVLTPSIEAAIRSEFGMETAVLLRTHDEVVSLVAAAPLATPNPDPDAKPYIVLLRQPAALAPLPLFSPNGDVEVAAPLGRDLVCWSHQVKGKYGFPNAFVEKAVSSPATTRGWPTILRTVGV